MHGATLYLLPSLWSLIWKSIRETQNFTHRGFSPAGSFVSLLSDWKGNYPIWGPSYPYMCQFHSENCPCIASWPELWTLALGKPSLNCTLLNLPPPTPSYLPLPPPTTPSHQPPPLILCLLPFLSRGAVTLHAPYRLLGSKPCSAASVHISSVCSAVIVRATGLIMLIAGSRKAMVVCALWAGGGGGSGGSGSGGGGGGPELNVHILSHYYVTSILIQSHYFVIYIPI